MLVPVADIKVKKRFREDLGDIGALAESMKRLGQISPIVITRKNVLVAGGRRLEAARILGWRTINAIIMDTSDEITRLELELEENIQRRDFTPLETEKAAERIHALRNPSLIRRILNGIAAFFKRLFRIED